MKLPVGVYVVCSDFADKEKEVSFFFKGECYTAVMGQNAFYRLDDFLNAPLCAPQAPFFGYGDTPVLIFPAGIYDGAKNWEGTPKEMRLCRFFPQAITVLGENAGVSPNGPDLRTANPLWKTESVFAGNLYFGAVGMQGTADGMLTFDGMTFQSGRICDDRTGGENVGLTVKNCAFRSFKTQDWVATEPLTDPNATRQVLLSDIRCDGIEAMDSQSRLCNLLSGSLTVRRLYFANTDTFPGLTDFLQEQACGRPGEKATVTYEACIFENCTAPCGFSLCLPKDSQMTVRMTDCAFYNAAPKGVSPLSAHLPGKDCRLELTDCTFDGEDTVPAVLVSGDENACIQCNNVTAEGFLSVWARKAPPRTQPIPDRDIFLTDPHTVAENDFSALDALYRNKHAYHGDAHAHSDSGGTSDGEVPLGEFVQQLKSLQLDFAAIVDHRQMRHFFLPQWDESMLICGTEPCAKLIGKPYYDLSAVHYCMLFPDKEGLGKTLAAFPEFEYTGGTEGSFSYPRFTRERFYELGEFVYSLGGLMSHAHPKQGMLSPDPMDYYVSDHVAMETVHGDVAGYASLMNRNLWTTLLATGKRVRTYGSTDTHEQARQDGQTTLYAEKRLGKAFLEVIRRGDCTAGAAGIQMAIDNTAMGGELPYKKGQTLLIRVGDYHPFWKQDSVYRLQVFTDRGLAYATEFTGVAPVQIALSVQKRGFYRAEITDMSRGSLAALSNPIWLD